MQEYEVASHAEAWIEISVRLRFLWKDMVASHAEAWIEIYMAKESDAAKCVASHAEAWIEISRLSFGKS